MVASAMDVQWQRTQDALRVEVDRVTGLLRSIRDPDRPAVGTWTLGDVAMHLSQAWLVVPCLARGDLSPVYDLLPALAGSSESGSLIPDLMSLDQLTGSAVGADPERDPAALADRIEQRAEAYLADCAAASADESRAWLVEGSRLRLSNLTGHLLNETVMHGYDIATAAGVPWRLVPEHAGLVLGRFIMPVINAVDPASLVHAKAAGVRVRYDLRIRGADRFRMVFDQGTVQVLPPSGEPVDCHISADPVAFLMVIWQRQSQWSAIAQGKLMAWGRKPWMGLRLRSFLLNP